MDIPLKDTSATYIFLNWIFASGHIYTTDIPRGYFPNRHFFYGHFPEGNFLEWRHFSDRYFSDGYFPERIFPWSFISPIEKCIFLHVYISICLYSYVCKFCFFSFLNCLVKCWHNIFIHLTSPFYSFYLWGILTRWWIQWAKVGIFQVLGFTWMFRGGVCSNDILFDLSLVPHWGARSYLSARRLM